MAGGAVAATGTARKLAVVIIGVAIRTRRVRNGRFEVALRVATTACHGTVLAH